MLVLIKYMHCYFSACVKLDIKSIRKQKRTKFFMTEPPLRFISTRYLLKMNFEEHKEVSTEYLCKVLSICWLTNIQMQQACLDYEQAGFLTTMFLHTLWTETMRLQTAFSTLPCSVHSPCFGTIQLCEREVCLHFLIYRLPLFRKLFQIILVVLQKSLIILMTGLWFW